MASSSDTPASSKVSLLSRDTTSSAFTSSSKGKKKSAKDYLSRLKAGLGGKSSPTASSTASASSEGPPSTSSGPSAASASTSKSVPTYKTSLAPERDWDKAFGELATSYGFAGTPTPGGRPVAPSKKYKARTAPTNVTPTPAPPAPPAPASKAEDVGEEQSDAQK